ASIKKRTHIPAQGLGPALREFAQGHELQIIYVSEDVAKLSTRGVAGEVTTDEALRTLLQGTQLDYRYLDERTITVFSAEDTQSMPTPDDSLAGSLHLAQAGGASPAAASISSDSRAMALEEVIVTATKRPESVRRISGSVSAL